MKKATAGIVWFALSLPLVASIILANSPSAKALESYTAYATEDTWISSQFPTTNYGGATNLFELYNTSGPKEGRVLFKFDLSAIPAGSTISMATLFVYSLSDAQSCYGQPSGNFYVSQINSSWSESTVTWSNQPTTYANTSNLFSCGTTGYIPLDVKNIVSGIVSGELQNNGLMIIGLLNSTNWQRTIRSRETGQNSTAKVVVSYTLPSPSPAPTETPADSSSPSSQAPSATASTSSQPGVTAGTNAAPSATTSSSIKPPGELAVQDVSSNVPSIKLSWQKSATTSISGYKVYRSEKEKENFKNIAITETNTLSFTDTSVENGKAYYYFVRAYKDKLESASSKTVSLAPAVKTVTEQSASTPSAESQRDDGGMSVWRKWSLIGLVAGLIMLVGLLVIYEILFKKRPPKPRSTHNNR